MLNIPHSRSTLSDENFDFIKETYLSGIITSNSKVDFFKTKFRRYINKEYIELYSSASQALYDLLLTMDIKEDDEILIPSYICNSVKKSILKVGAKPIFYDNEKKSWISSSKEIQTRITKNTKVIIINHTFGIRYEKKEIEKILKCNIPMIEDCAHFISSKNIDIEVSNLFMASFYSFNATKLLATGEGGAICTNDRVLADKLVKHKLDEGFSDLNASLGLAQLNQFNNFLEKREEIANYYFQNLGDITKDLKEYSSIYFRFPIFVKDDILFLKSNSRVIFRKGVDDLLHLGKEINLPKVEEVFKETISIPIYPSLTKKEQNIIIEEVKRLIDEN